MAEYPGVRAKGAGIEIRYQAGGKRRSVYIDKAATATNKADAARYRKRLVEQANLGEQDQENATFEDCCSGFLSDKAQSLKPSTVDGYKSKLEVYWSPLSMQLIRTIRLSDIKAIDRAVPWQSQKTRRDAHAVLRGVFDWAIGEELATENPASKLTVGAWQRPAVDAFSDAERAALMAELRGAFRVFYGLMFEGGFRTGELQALRWSAVHGDYIEISASMYRGEEGSPKTHQTRQVLLTDTAQALVKGFTESRFDPSGYVFVSRRGEPYSTDRSLTIAFRNACKRAGVRYRRPYYCRHTFATRAIAAGIDPSFVARQMGDLVETVLRHYTGWNNARDREQLARLSGEFAGKEKPRITKNPAKRG